MNDDLHPHWQATDAEEQSVPVRPVEHPLPKTVTSAPPPSPPNGNPITVSRQPAAFAGIFLVITIGIALFAMRGTGTFAHEILVRITAEGFSPAVVTVPIGAQIRWQNDTSGPHILQSDKLCTVSHRCFLTAPVPPNGSTSMIITDEFVPGTYAYYSISAKNFVGSVVVTAAEDAATEPINAQLQGGNLDTIVPAAEHEEAEDIPDLPATEDMPSIPPPSANEGPAAPASPPLFPPSETAAPPSFSAPSPMSNDTWNYTFEEPLTTDMSPSPPATASSSSTNRQGTRQSVPIPTNPYTVGSTQSGPAQTTRGLHGAASQKPLSQPASGPAAWIAALATLGLLLALTRGSLRRWHS